MRAIEVASRKGKGWMLVGGLLMVFALVGAMGGDPRAAGKTFVFGLMVYGIGRAIRWWHRV